jgi:MFS transporter, MHS family, shikimate and dehydroshikimate transport protein
VRARVPETPLFQDLRSRGDVLKNPFFEAVLRNPRVFLIAVGLKLSEVSWVYILTVFVVVYGTKTLGLSRQLLLNAVFVAALVELFTIPLFGWLSDVWGRRHLYFVGTLFTIGFAFPLFWLLETRNPAIIVPTVIIALSFGHGTMFGLQSTFFPELFATRVRYTGASFGFQTSAAIGGGLAPILATVLADRMGGTAGVSILLILLALITLVATLCARETRHDSLERQ